MFLERSVTIMFRDVGTIEQVLYWTNRLPFLEKSLDYISSRISPVLSPFSSVIDLLRSSLKICS